MNKNFKIAAGLILAAAMATTIGFAFDYGEVAPGGSAGFDKGSFFIKGSGYVIEPGVEFNDNNFAIQKKTIKTGANLVENIRFNNRAQEIQVSFKASGVSQAPNRPNVVISELSVRAIRNISDGSGGYELRSGTIYTVGEEITFRVGLATTEMAPDRDGVSISLESGEQEYVKWNGGSGSGKVSVSYGSMLYAEGRVYDGDKALYSYNSTVDDTLQNRNPNAYIVSVNMGSGTFPQPIKVQLMASQSDYIYEYNDGRLSASKLKWSRDDDAWIGTLDKGKHFISSDIKLSGINGATGNTGSASSSSDYDDNDSTDAGFDNNYFNPSTGGGNIAVSISAIVAIVAIAAVSIIMSTILSAKKIKKD